MPRLIPILVLLLALAAPVCAEMRYVTDQVLVSLRPSADDRGEPLERLATGTGVEVLEDLGPMLKVKSPAGNVGYVYSRYFLAAPPKGGGSGAAAALQERLALQEQKNAELTAELQRLKTAPPAGGEGALAQELEKSRNELAELNKRYQALQAQGGASEELLRERDRLKQELAELSTARGTGQGQIGSPVQWFLAGAGVFLVGWLVGKSSRPKRRL